MIFELYSKENYKTLVTNTNKFASNVSRAVNNNKATPLERGV